MSWRWKPAFIEKRERARKEQECKEQRSDDTAALNDIKQAYIDAHKDDKRNEKWKSAREWATVVLVAFTVIFTGLSYCVFNSQLVVSRDTEERQLRAYVLPSESEIVKLSEGEPVSATVVIHNFGLTPGYRMRGWGGIEIVDLRFPYSLKPPPTQQWQSLGYLAPGAISKLHTQTPEKLTDGQVRGLKGGYVAVFIWGRVEYTDTFRHPHWTTFTRFYGGPAGTPTDGSTVESTQGNETDDQ
jgi:hypothetical protein